MLGAGGCQATCCLLPGSSSRAEAAFRVSICISPLPGPRLQHRLSPALVSRICTWHVALYCVLGVFAVPAGPCFTSAQQPGGTCSGPSGWGLAGDHSGALGSLLQETAELRPFRQTIAWSLVLIGAVDGMFFRNLLPVETIRLLIYE